MHNFPDKSQNEQRTLTFDFAPDFDDGGVAVLTGPVVVIECTQGTDPNAASMLSGAPVVVGQTVRQLCIAGVNGCNYLLTCRVTSSPEVPELAGRLRIRRAT